MTACPCDAVPRRILRIPAGLSALPRQTQAFPEVRLALLASVAGQPALDGWRARGERDFGLMWLEMWAYVCDVLGFYDERIANESYLRTAVRRPSLRRIVDLLGYVTAPGVAGSATIAAIAEGRSLVSVPAGTAFRSDAFADQAPQVFETTAAATIHPLLNSWEIGPVSSTTLAAGSSASTATLSELTFETRNFGLAKDRLVAFTWPGQDPSSEAPVSRVSAVRPFEGKDGKTYLSVQLSAGATLPLQLDAASIRVQVPTVSALATRNTPPVSAEVPDPTAITADGLSVYLDTVYRQLRVGDAIIAVREAVPSYELRYVTVVSEVLATIDAPAGAISIPITKLTFDKPLADPTADASSFSFQFAFVSAGQLTTVAETQPAVGALSAPGGVPLVGLVERPPTAPYGVLYQTFLLRDADNRGAKVKGTMFFRDDGTASFAIDQDAQLPANLKTPITVFGNVLEVGRGESVFNEILGSGNPRVARQTFKLKKKPLTYVQDPSIPGGAARSTLRVTVDGVLWDEARSFFGKGPEDRVYIVRPDDQGNSLIIFGDGIRGARVPSGVKNVRANYRFGSGQAAPPAGALRQLARAVKGLRRVESPIDAAIGRDPDAPETLRTLAPRSVLLFGRAVSTLDFEALASLQPGVVKASAEFLWIPEAQEAGVIVTYIGSAEQEKIFAALKDQADPGLTLQARRADGRPAYLYLEVEVDPHFDPALVRSNVLAALLDEQTGPLAPRNAPIGQLLLRSVLFDTVHRVRGVASVSSATAYWLPPNSGTWSFVDFRDSSSVGICPGAGAFLDFRVADAVFVNGTTATTPVAASGGG
jgi:hypothetical protein